MSRVQLLNWIKFKGSTMSELISDITYDALKALLKKYPRKKGAFNEYIKENGLTDMDELTDDMGLELLEILDSASYIKALRARDEEKYRIHHANLVTAIDDFLAANKDLYFLLDKVDNCYLICKKIHIMVQTRNENSVFQPYQTTLEKEYMINFLVKLKDDFEPTEMINHFLTRGCRMVKVNNIDSIARILNGVN